MKTRLIGHRLLNTAPHSGDGFLPRKITESREQIDILKVSIGSMCVDDRLKKVAFDYVDFLRFHVGLDWVESLRWVKRRIASGKDLPTITGNMKESIGRYEAACLLDQFPVNSRLEDISTSFNPLGTCRFEDVRPYRENGEWYAKNPFTGEIVKVPESCSRMVRFNSD